MTPEEARAIADDAAEAAVEKLLRRFGYDAEDPEDARRLERVSSDLRFLHGWHNATETVRKQGFGAAITALILGAMGLLWLGITTRIGGGQ